MQANHHANEARRARIPPELRRFARRHAAGVTNLSRFDPEYETAGPKWSLTAKTVRLNRLPDGYRFLNGYARFGRNAGLMTVQIEVER